MARAIWTIRYIHALGAAQRDPKKVPWIDVHSWRQIGEAVFYAVIVPYVMYLLGHPLYPHVPH